MVVCGSLHEALRATNDREFRVVTGSLYLVGEALEFLGASAKPALDERHLNEYVVASR